MMSFEEKSTYMSICDMYENKMRGFREVGLCDISCIGLDWTFQKKVSSG
jgi:hypothetical protein